MWKTSLKQAFFGLLKPKPVFFVFSFVNSAEPIPKIFSFVFLVMS
jgi:hypothetical protein